MSRTRQVIKSSRTQRIIVSISTGNLNTLSFSLSLALSLCHTLKHTHSPTHKHTHVQLKLDELIISLSLSPSLCHTLPHTLFPTPQHIHAQLKLDELSNYQGLNESANVHELNESYHELKCSRTEHTQHAQHLNRVFLLKISLDLSFEDHPFIIEHAQHLNRESSRDSLNTESNNGQKLDESSKCHELGI